MEQQTPHPPPPPKLRMRPREGQKRAIFPSLIWGGGGGELKVFHLFCPRLQHFGVRSSLMSPNLVSFFYLFVIERSVFYINFGYSNPPNPVQPGLQYSSSKMTRTEVSLSSMQGVFAPSLCFVRRVGWVAFTKTYVYVCIYIYMLLGR